MPASSFCLLFLPHDKLGRMNDFPKRAGIGQVGAAVHKPIMPPMQAGCQPLSVYRRPLSICLTCLPDFSSLERIANITTRAAHFY